MSLTRKLLASLAMCGLTAVVVAAATWSSFSATTANPSNSFSAGTVAISDNDAGATLSASSMSPGSSTSGCIQVTYTGSLVSAVHQYASTTGSLAQYLNLTITRGTQSAPSFPSCTGFTADSTNYVGAGAGVVYSGTLSSFASTNTSYSNGLVDPQAWNQNDTHGYKFTVVLPSGAPAAAQGLSSTATFTWEARNQ